jgi:tetrahydromethanopterin S-methyltransferase subunit G
MKSGLSNKQRSEDLKRLAYECAERKYSGCNTNCNKCPLNISLYLEDPHDAVLIQANAELDYQKNVQYQNEQIQRQIEYQKQETAESIGKLIGWLLAIGIPIIGIYNCISGG